MNDSLVRLWDKGQLVIILSRTKAAMHTIFVGNKADTIDALRSILQREHSGAIILNESSN